LRQAGAKDVQQLMIEGADHFSVIKFDEENNSLRRGRWFSGCSTMTLGGSFIICLRKSFLFDQEAVAKKNGRAAQYRSGARAARAI
jgi:hypothetical protein